MEDANRFKIIEKSKESVPNINEIDKYGKELKNMKG